MSQRNQGLARDNNLSEPLDDGQAITNLAGAGVDQDLFIFINNLNNTSELIWDPNALQASITTSSTGAQNKRFLFGQEVPFTFTTNDVITNVTVRNNLNVDSDGEYVDAPYATDSTKYYVVDLALGQGSFRNQRAFGLATTENGTAITIPTAWRTRFVELTRSDAVTQDNIVRIATPEIQNNSANNGGDIGAASSFGYSIGETFNAAFETIESNVDIANFKRVQKYSESASVASDRDIKLEGSIRSGDPDGANDAVSKLDRDTYPTAPGIYITDPFSDITDIEATRAFSTSANPWSEATGKLTTESEQVNIGNLLFANGIEVDGLSITTASGNVKDAGEFTHKLGVNIDGVEYFLCLGPA